MIDALSICASEMRISMATIQSSSPRNTTNFNIKSYLLLKAGEININCIQKLEQHLSDPRFLANEEEP